VTVALGISRARCRALNEAASKPLAQGGDVMRSLLRQGVCLAVQRVPILVSGDGLDGVVNIFK
jgi:hypothetical protein